MKTHRFIWFASFMMWLFFSSVAYGALKENTLRIMSYNIHGGVGLDGVVDYERIANVIKRVDPDVVAIQEVDSVTDRSNKKDVLLEIAKDALMYHTYAPAIYYRGGKYGIGILSKEKPKNFYYLPLPGREEERTFLVVEFDNYYFCCTHLSLTPEDQLASIPILRKEAAKAQKPLFIAGDLNATPESATIKELENDFQILTNSSWNTFPADKPDSCIDYIAAYKTSDTPFSLFSNAVWYETVASDHRPVVADIRFRAKKEDIFRTNPYLQNPDKDAITVMWQTNVTAYSWVEYGTDTTNLQKARAQVDGQVICGLNNKIRLTNLRPGQKYYYRVCSREITLYEAYKKEFGETAVSGFSSFTLPEENTTDFTAIIFNDVHKQEKTYRALYEQVKDIPYDFVVFNGDCIDDPSNEDVAVKYMSLYCDIVKANNVPVFFRRGNHEIRNAYSVGLRDLFDYPGGKSYGAFNWGDTRIVMLDCGEDKPDDTWVYYGLNDFSGFREEQTVFLNEELKSKAFKKAGRKVLMNHIPVYGNVDEYNPCPELWGKLLEKAPFDINLSGHTHSYAFYPKGSLGNNFPVIVGGGYSMSDATVMILQRKGKEMNLRVLNTEGKVLLNLKL